MKTHAVKRWLRRSSPKQFGYVLFVMILAMLLIPTITAVDVRPVPNQPSSIETTNNNIQTAQNCIEKQQPLLTIAHLEPTTIGKHQYYYATGTQHLETTIGSIFVNITTLIDTQSYAVTINAKTVKTAKETWQESPTSLVIFYNDQILTLENVAEKETKYKALDNFIEPLINPQYLTNPKLPQKEEFLVISEAVLSESQPLVTIDGYSFHVIQSEDLRPLFRNRQILKLADNEPGNLQKLVNYARQLFRAEAEQLIKDLDFRKSHDDVISYPLLQNYLSEEPWNPEPGQTSPYQRYVTPSDPSVEKLSQSISDKYAAYQLAKTWTWVSDSHLFNQAEKWLLPTTFLSETPNYKTNPVSGTPASDCSEQANTLCSLLRTMGISAEDVRVAIGKVNFDGTIGGHAWVEIKEDNNWLVLDPTSGPYYDDEQQRIVSRNGVEYSYWKYHPYPIEEIWAYYNDQYFTDENAEVADGWATPYDVFLNEEMFAGFFSYDSQNIYFTFIIILALSGIFLVIFVGNRLYNSKKP